MGRKPTLQIGGVLILLFWTITAFVNHVGLLCFAAVLGGYGVGATFVVLPLYLSEVSDSRVRGSNCSLFFLMFSAGILYGSFMHQYFKKTAACLLSLPIPIAFLFIINCSWTPESPYFLVAKEKFAEARRVLLDLGMKEEGKYVATDDLIEFDNVTVHFHRGHDPCRHMFRIKENRNALFTQAIIFMVQVSSSYVPILFTSMNIFIRVTGDMRPAPAENLYSAIQLFGSIFCFLVIDSYDRKPLLLTSCFIVIAGQICLGLCYYFDSEGIHHVHSWVFVFVTSFFIMGYSIGLGPIPWILMAETFGPHIRSLAASGLVLMVSIFLLSIPRVFLQIAKHLGVYMACWIFSAVVSLGASCIFFLFVETRHKTIHSMANDMEEEMLYCGEDPRRSQLRLIES
ncbi:facilitated trehalose transporter Tret1 [Anabrus simplex]|uniref:facilitated trehalose transporter Tret1 n=1 Tax=Anabrus simplex TaxID=316456 RepID=UPI0034DDBABE